MDIKSTDELMQMSSSELQMELELADKQVNTIDDEIDEIERARNAHLQTLLEQLAPYDDQIRELVSTQEEFRQYGGTIAMTCYRKSQLMHGELQGLIIRFLNGETITEKEANEWQSRWTEEEQS